MHTVVPRRKIGRGGGFARTNPRSDRRETWAGKTKKFRVLGNGTGSPGNGMADDATGHARRGPGKPLQREHEFPRQVLKHALIC